MIKNFEWSIHVCNMLPISFGPGILLRNTTEFYLYLTEDISFTMAHGSMRLRK